MADEICSTSGMLAAVRAPPEARTFLIATDWALIHSSRSASRTASSFPRRCIGCRLHCSLHENDHARRGRALLLENVFEITVDPEDAVLARRALERMMAVPRDR